MIIRLIHSCSIPIWINSPKLHVNDTWLLDEVYIMERYVTSTYRLHDLKGKEKNYASIGMYLYSLSTSRVSVFSRRSWNIYCRGIHLSAGIADMLRHRLPPRYFAPPTLLKMPFRMIANFFSKKSVLSWNFLSVPTVNFLEFRQKNFNSRVENYFQEK